MSGRPPSGLAEAGRGPSGPDDGAVGSSRGRGPSGPADPALKDAFLAEVQRAKAGFARLTLAGAHKVEVEGDRIVFSFAPAQKMFKDQVESNRAWLEPLAARVAGRKMHVTAVVSEPPAAAAAPARPGAPPAEKLGSPAGPSEALKVEAAADPGMQTLLELLPLEIKDVERI